MKVATRLALTILAALGGCEAGPGREGVRDVVVEAGLGKATATDARRQRAATVLAEMKQSDLSADQRLAVDELLVAIRQVDRTPRFRGPPRYARVDRGPANLRAAPSLDASIVAVLDVGTVVDIRDAAESWRRVEVINAPTIRAGYIQSDLLEAGLAENGGWASGQDGLDPALAGFSETFSSSASFQCLDDLKLCKQRHAWFDCELVMIVCIGEAFIGSLN